VNLGDYPTPGDVKIYIDDLWVDDAYRIDYEEQDKKIPLWGYHQKKYSDVADGKAIVVGNIIIHYRFPGYLNHAIQRALIARESAAIKDAAVAEPVAPPAPAGPGGAPAVAPDTPKPKTATVFHVKDMLDLIRRQPTPSEMVKQLQLAATSGHFEVASAALQELFGSNSSLYLDQNLVPGALDNAIAKSPVTESPGAYVSGWKGFDLRLDYGYIGTRTQGVFHSEVLKGVHLTGRRKVVNASTAGGDLSASGQSLVEVYPFFCREVQAIVRRETTSTGAPR
jgi:hypothetical protein